MELHSHRHPTVLFCLHGSPAAFVAIPLGTPQHPRDFLDPRPYADLYLCIVSVVVVIAVVVVIVIFVYTFSLKCDQHTVCTAL